MRLPPLHGVQKQDGLVTWYGLEWHDWTGLDWKWYENIYTMMHAVDAVCEWTVNVAVKGC